MKTRTIISFVILFFLLTINISFSATNSGAVWIETSFNYNTPTSFAAIGNNLFACLSGPTSSNGVNLTTDDGTTWSYANHSAENICSGGPFLFAARNNQPYVYRSTDNGSSWNTTGFINADGWISVIASGRNIFASRYVMQRSTDNGETWSILSGISSSFLYCHAVSNGLVFATSDVSYLYRSTNNGDNWANTTFPILRVSSVAISGNTVFVSTETAGVYVSTNSGDTWTQTSLSPQSVSSVIIKDGYVIAGTSNGVFISSDNGNNWVSINEGLPTGNAGPVFVNNNFIFTGVTGRGIWKISLTEVTAIHNTSTEVPNEFSLSQNYPNPFNPSTKIDFNIPKAGFVKLIVYDATGREKTSLFSGHLSAGKYSYDFNALDLASGIYFYRLEAGDFSQTRKMVLIK